MEQCCFLGAYAPSDLSKVHAAEHSPRACGVALPEHMEQRPWSNSMLFRSTWSKVHGAQSSCFPRALAASDLWGPMEQSPLTVLKHTEQSMWSSSCLGAKIARVHGAEHCPRARGVALLEHMSLMWSMCCAF